jgi:Uma2 family endonuclease
MSAFPIARWTLEEYLEREETADERHEFLDGLIVAMAGGLSTHDLLSVNAGALMNLATRGRPCRVHGSNLRLYIAQANVVTYPDAMVVCGPYVYERKRRDLISNPILIVEVLSRSTESYDRGKKFEYYRTVGSLREYVLVSQTEPLVERFARRADGRWALDDFRGLEAELPLDSIEARIPLRELYDKVDFDEGAAEA